MRIVCVWREGYDYSRTVEDWMSEFVRRTGVEIETIDPGTHGGEMFCEAYGVVQYPTILALDESGAVMADWKGELMPTFDEVASWVTR